ncbi:MAG: tRNA (adenosine(37)-N6)-threonylcarbamoyltransferase complex dimerization subunit type 1 TsaB [Gammaproteobacteria bacterium]|nr:tRNA (adenosine(37)-N6)-threonylcarbamoyltransferase complex dimerization subunit type 1 TsaB [Gammaproteobacteria bacterium]MCP4088849.1 tRNA (adenosine(37)-N6)-threonylcarbamoyltransferase complex dimerization subunit type 1 TsaB [Gammaproteobacteria bacterium]MCP4274865.1 tRNA (adenosine(37)-N6)-threonylcarbamoyltransferase complex dimerization subunit type 1 TsaB [Gammaproteobacteria bacterium]MCP4832068.1 tRNA (adenosine(37)-N6)-threonylcarbamoyltransferase complex dimerization subunit t
MSQFRCVALETATAQGSVAACSGEQVAIRMLKDSKTSSREIFGVVAEVLAELELHPGDLDCIAYGSGPGSFTGVRVAASAAQGLAFAQALPVCRVSSLEAMAASVMREKSVLMVAASLDARMDEAYLGVYTMLGNGRLRCEFKDALINPKEYKLVARYPDAFAAGNGWEIWPAMLVDHNADADFTVWPRAFDVLELARNQFADGLSISAHQALPNYVRDNVTQ